MRRFAGVVMLVAFAAAGGPPARLGFTNAPVQVPAGSCSPLLTVQLQDDAGTAVDAGANLAVGLSGAVEFHEVATCATPPIIQVQIDAGANATSFRVQGTVAGRYPVTAAAAGLASAIQDVEVIPGVPGRVAFLTGPFTVNAGECSPEIVFQVQDDYGNVSPPPGLGLDASTSSPNARVYADPGCTTPRQPFSIVAPESGGSFYFRGSVAETLNVVMGGTVGSSPQAETVRAVSAELALSLSGDPASAGSTLVVHASVTNTGAGTLTGPRLFLTAEGLALESAGPYALPALAPGGDAGLDLSGIITATSGADVVVRGHAETSGGLPLEPEVTVRQAVSPMVADLGGCGCSAGGLPLAAAGVAIALASALRGTRRRSAGSR